MQTFKSDRGMAEGLESSTLTSDDGREWTGVGEGYEGGRRNQPVGTPEFYLTGKVKET